MGPSARPDEKAKNADTILQTRFCDVRGSVAMVAACRWASTLPELVTCSCSEIVTDGNGKTYPEPDIILHHDHGWW